jgi:hypothetical protein
MIAEEESAPDVFACDIAASKFYLAWEEEHQEVPGRQTFVEYLATFVSMSYERRPGWDPYQTVSENAVRQIPELVVKFDQSPREVEKIFNV